MSWALASLRHPGSSRRVLMAALASTFKRFESCSMHPIHGWQSETATRSPLPLLRQHPRCALRTSGTWLRSGVPVRHPLRAHHPRSGCGASTLTPVYRACPRRARKPHLDAVRECCPRRGPRQSRASPGPSARRVRCTLGVQAHALRFLPGDPRKAVLRLTKQAPVMRHPGRTPCRTVSVCVRSLRAER